MITILDLQLNRITILENAYDIGYDKKENQIISATFKLPFKDSKNDKVKQMHYVEIVNEDTGEYIGLFQVMPIKTRKSINAESVTYECKHVLCTLIGVTLFKYHQIANYTTREVLEWLLSQQHTQHWQLGKVDFTRYFHYSWENENLLSALFSVPKPFNEQYEWTWNTQSYPWTLNLESVETVATARIAEGHNLIGLEIEENPNSLWNRIYPLGAGEGVNQLTIEKVNGGSPYVENAESIAKYGLYETTWVDQRFTNEDSLKASAEGLLERWKDPIISLNINAADLSYITGVKVDKLKQGKVIKLQLDDRPVIDLRILRETRADIYGNPIQVDLELGNLLEDLGATTSDLQRRQQINELYSQGATNILNYTYQDNCDDKIPAVIPFYVDDDVVNVNTVELTFRTKKFRAYSRATEGGGSTVKSTSSGGGSSQTSTSGGGTSTSTQSGGGSSQTSGASSASSSGGVWVQSGIAIGTTGIKAVPDLEHQHQVYLSNMAHSHTISHNHSVAIPAHTHGFTTPNHTHNVTIPAHAHDIELPDHVHEVKHEIIELDSTPSEVVIKVDGNIVPHTSTSGNRINLVDYMDKDSNGKITRGRHEVEILPNDLARIEADLILRVFIQSRLGGVY